MYYKIRDNLSEINAEKGKSDRRFTLVLCIIIFLMTVLVALNTFVFFNVCVEGSSMESTLFTGDILIANRHKKIEHGDIVVVDGVKKANGQYLWLIKRVIGMEGDTIQIKGGMVYVNGKIIEEPYLDAGMKTFSRDFPEGEDILTVGKDEIYYLGDNRTVSEDSRRNGVCKESQIVGVIEDWSMNLRPVNGFIFRIRNLLTGKK